jgi:hypothetical protein
VTVAVHGGAESADEISMGQGQRVPTNDGSALEAAIAGYLASQGYEVSCNEVMVGRSGAPHEIDVLAVRPDPVARVTLAVECKAWQKPVEKGVLSKLDYVIRDCGINKGIVASTGGFRSGAQRAADELSIDVWGPDKLTHLLGAAAVHAVQSSPVTREAIGWPFRTTVEQAQRRVRTEARGSVVLGRQETVYGMWPAWIPVHVGWLSVAQPERKWGRITTVSRPIANRYDALCGNHAGPVPSMPIHIDLGTLPVIGELVSPAKVSATITKAVDAAKKVTTDAAKARHAQKLAGLGVPWPCAWVNVERVEPAVWPVWVAGLEGRGAQRLVAVDGTTGAADPKVSAVLTEKMSHVRSYVG